MCSRAEPGTVGSLMEASDLVGSRAAVRSKIWDVFQFTPRLVYRYRKMISPRSMVSVLYQFTARSSNREEVPSLYVNVAFADIELPFTSEDTRKDTEK